MQTQRYTVTQRHMQIHIHLHTNMSASPPHANTRGTCTHSHTETETHMYGHRHTYTNQDTSSTPHGREKHTLLKSSSVACKLHPAQTGASESCMPLVSMHLLDSALACVHILLCNAEYKCSRFRDHKLVVLHANSSCRHEDILCLAHSVLNIGTFHRKKSGFLISFWKIRQQWAFPHSNSWFDLSRSCPI